MNDFLMTMLYTLKAMKRCNDLGLDASVELMKKFAEEDNYVGEYYNKGKMSELEQANRNIDELLVMVEKEMGLEI